MHACGHDGHTVSLLGAAALLAADPDSTGTVHLIFQPAEEGHGGAQAMMADGLLERFPIERVFAYHNWPGLPPGTVAVHDGAVMAGGARLTVTLFGHAGHAGMPHLTRDRCWRPVICWWRCNRWCARVDPLESVVVSICMVDGGVTANQIPSEVCLRGTLRAFKPAVRELVEACLTVAGISKKPLSSSTPPCSAHTSLYATNTLSLCELPKYGLLCWRKSLETAHILSMPSSPHNNLSVTIRKSRGLMPCSAWAEHPANPIAAEHETAVAVSAVAVRVKLQVEILPEPKPHYFVFGEAGSGERERGEPHAGRLGFLLLLVLDTHALSSARKPMTSANASRPRTEIARDGQGPSVHGCRTAATDREQCADFQAACRTAHRCGCRFIGDNLCPPDPVALAFNAAWRHSSQTIDTPQCSPQSRTKSSVAGISRPVFAKQTTTSGGSVPPCAWRTRQSM